ncbi:MAG: HU family DNA-binding protein [Bacteroidaceae bacterium]|nr:HU family DNA-binding protein [Bacteroidaceae bacterium]
MDAKLNHSDLSALLAKQAEISGAKAEVFTKAFFDIILEGLEQDGMVKINGLGTFKVTDVASRSSVDVNTGEKIEIKGHKKLTFLPADSLKEKVNQPFAMFEPVEIDESYVDDSEEPAMNETEAQEDATAVEDTPVTTPCEEPVTVEEPAAAEEAEPAEDAEIPAIKEEEVTKEEETPATEPVAEEVPAIEETKEEAKEATAEPVAENAVSEQPAQREVKNSYPITEPAPATAKPTTNRKRGVIYTLFIIAAILVAVIIYLRPQLFGIVETGKKTVATVETTPTKVVEEVKPDSVEVAAEQPIEEPYTFAMVDELAVKSVGSITRGDTLLYVANDTIATHIVAADETLVRISLKYYGDKRLWPYIVQYNKLHDPNGLSKGMELLIPRLQPAK